MADEMGLGKTVGIALLLFRPWLLTLIAPMHCTHVDTTQTVFRGWKVHYPEMRHSMSLNFSEKLGQRAGSVQFLTCQDSADGYK